MFALADTLKASKLSRPCFEPPCKQAGLLGQKVIVEVSNQPVAPKGITYKWGTLEFKLIGPAQGQIAAQ